MNERKHRQSYSVYLDSIPKRIFDVLLCLLLILPVLLLTVGLAILVLFCDGRPIFFSHNRVGKNGRIFKIYKIRSMATSAHPYKPSSETHPSRITLTGKFLRRHRLDELPQILCVFWGHMTLVGPRPEMPQIVASYKSCHKRRLAAKPGMTGLWQLFGDRDEHIHKHLKYDLYYLRKASLWLDLKILAMTVPFMLKGK